MIYVRIAFVYATVFYKRGSSLSGNDVVAVLQISKMPILTIIIVLIVVGVLLWLINTYIPMQRSIKSILNAVVIIVVVIWLLKVFGLLSGLQNLHT